MIELPDLYGYLEEKWKKFTQNVEIVQNNPCKYCQSKKKNLEVAVLTGETRQNFNDVNKRLESCQVLFGFSECEGMLNILRKLEYVNEQNIPMLKTRIARELGGGEENIYLVELIVENILNNLEPAEIVALVSIFVGHGRSRDEVDTDNLEIPETLGAAILEVKKIIEKIGALEKQFEVTTEFEANYLNIKVLYEWGMQREFIEVCEYTQLAEGSIVRSIQRVEQTMKSIQRALNQVGNRSEERRVGKEC